MFVATRIVNGLIAVLSLFAALLLSMVGSLSTRPFHVNLAFVVGLFVLDLLFRRKNSRSDVVFVVVWILYFLLSIAGMLIRPTSGTALSGSSNDVLFVALTSATIYVVPFLLNAIYCSTLLKSRKTAT